MAKKSKTGSADSEEPSANALEANPSEPNIVVWSDPEWEPALHALEAEKPDLRPLAKLLRSGRPVPEAVATQLGVLLDPPWGNKGPRLILSVSKRYSGHADLQTIKAMMSAKREIEKELLSRGKLESAIEEVSTKLGYSRSYLMKAWTLDIKAIVRKMSRFNPQPFLSPHESDKS
jgi:hypothetical protein